MIIPLYFWEKSVESSSFQGFFIPFTFRPFLYPLLFRPKTAKSKAIAFTFRPFLADFSIFEIEAKK